MIYNVLQDKQFLTNIINIFAKNGVKISTYSLIAFILLATDETNKNLLKDFNVANFVTDIETITQIDNSTDYVADYVSKTIKERIELSNYDKINIILSKYNLTKEQFDILAAIVLAEAKANSYDDAYCVINTIYNRTISQTWRLYVDSVFDSQCGDSLYYQAICSGQFVVYETDIYKQFLNVTDLEGYQAIIDFLFTEQSKHQFLSFVANGCDSTGRCQFVPNGNLYYNELTYEDKISEPKTLSLLKSKRIIK